MRQARPIGRCSPFILFRQFRPVMQGKQSWDVSDDHRLPAKPELEPVRANGRQGEILDKTYKIENCLISSTSAGFSSFTNWALLAALAKLGLIFNDFSKPSSPARKRKK